METSARVVEIGGQKPHEIQQEQTLTLALGMDGWMGVLTHQGSLEHWCALGAKVARSRSEVVDRNRGVVIPFSLRIIEVCLKYSVQFWAA